MPTYHRDSIFGDGPRVRLNREEKAQYVAKLRLLRKPGGLTLAALQVGLTLVNMLGNDGRLDPTIDKLAAVARVSRSSVRSAISSLKKFGFLEWTRRLVRNRENGWRCEKTSNAYVLRVPACEVEIRTGVLVKSISLLRKNKQPAENKSDHAALWDFMAKCESVPDLLGPRRQLFERDKSRAEWRKLTAANKM